jgi:hypothetical protein
MGGQIAKVRLRRFIDKFGVAELFTALEDVAYERDVEEHKKDPVNTDYYWPGVVGIARSARERLMTLKGKNGRI